MSAINFDKLVRAVQLAAGVAPDGDPRERTFLAIYKKITGRDYEEPKNKYGDTKAGVLNRGIPSDEFLDELVKWGSAAPEDIFKPRFSNDDIYNAVLPELGPYESPLQRRAVMLEVMRVLAGFESSWDWNEGVDTTRKAADTNLNAEAGAWQVSADSLNFGQELKDLVRNRAGNLSGLVFQRAMKADHALAMEYVARLMRHTTKHNGPLYRDRHKIAASLRGPEHSIYPWLSRDSVKEFETLLTPAAVIA